MTKHLNLLLLIIIIASCKMNTKEKKETVLAGITQLSSPAKDSCAEPYLFADSKGLVYLSWIQKKGKENYFKFSTLENDNPVAIGWSQPVIISSGNNWFVNWADYPMLAADGANN
ncbi:MAG: hypothetical protein SGI83_01805, partial [Bacteroidota bacterium]|nr:hypothetical protein [Bacteroidota bacterium]